MLIDIQAVGTQIRKSRLQAGISQAELARLADVSRATINGIENSTIKEIGVNRLSRVIATSLNLPNLRNATAQTKRKSESLNLTFPYDWNNSSMPDSLLIDIRDIGDFLKCLHSENSFGINFRMKTKGDVFQFLA